MVNAGSPAANAGLAAGDVIVRASNRPVNSRSALAHAIRIGKGDAIPLAVLRDHREFILTLLPEKRKKF
ncbi:PDZ domain-containing protein [Acidipila sp. EB88]|uniref:PDZ domain-containing protein n=1 Tax=Acidipila sp. EB88 TaxID=2305226 RepID=UPI0013150B38|nr:PDZ domain-containing protein [Acidipila sp. EB88]